MGAARAVRELVEQGNRYRDITLVCTDMGQYQPLVNLIFPRMHIPVYQSGTEDILQKSMIATVLTALDAALSDFDQRSVVRYLRSALSGMDPDTCDRVENYAFLWGIRGNRWLQEWENHPDGLGVDWTEDDRQRLEKLNQAREKFLSPWKTFGRAFGVRRPFPSRCWDSTPFWKKWIWSSGWSRWPGSWTARAASGTLKF